MNERSPEEWGKIYQRYLSGESIQGLIKEFNLPVSNPSQFINVFPLGPIGGASIPPAEHVSNSLGVVEVLARDICHGWCSELLDELLGPNPEFSVFDFVTRVDENAHREWEKHRSRWIGAAQWVLSMDEERKNK